MIRNLTKGDSRPMSDSSQRIDQFRKMAADDPNNELGHFSLGRSLLEGGDAAEAAKSFQRVIALNPNISKAYQLLGEAQLQTGHRDLAVETLTNGANVANRRGDLMPRNQMLEKLRELGAPQPS